jgi:hypothetical protein
LLKYSPVLAVRKRLRVLISIFGFAGVQPTGATYKRDDAIDYFVAKIDWDFSWLVCL